MTAAPSESIRVALVGAGQTGLCARVVGGSDGIELVAAVDPQSVDH